MAYTRVNWEDAPSEKTPLSAENLNIMDKGIETLDQEKLYTKGDASNTTVVFTEETTLAKLNSGVKLSTLFGMLAKAISSLITHLADSVTHITQAERNAWNKKVDSVSGKGLSTNDYTTAEKNKLSGIASGAQVNTVTGVKGNAESQYRTGNINLTPTNIGAAASSHKHTKTEISDFPSTMPPSSHTQPASTITAGTLGGQVKANATAAAALTTAQVRDIAFVAEADAPEAGSTADTSVYPEGSLLYIVEAVS